MVEQYFKAKLQTEFFLETVLKASQLAVEKTTQDMARIMKLAKKPQKKRLPFKPIQIVSSPSKTLMTKQQRRHLNQNFKVQVQKQKQFTNDLHQQRKQRQIREKARREKMISKIKALQQEDIAAKQAAKKKIEEDKQIRLQKMTENSQKRKEQREKLKELKEDKPKGPPLYKKIQQKYQKQILVPELERKKAELARKRLMIHSISKQQLVSHAKKHHQHLLSQQAKKRRIIQQAELQAKLYLSSQPKTQFRQTIISQQKQLHLHKQQEKLKKKQMLDKMKHYSSLVKQLYPPKIPKQKLKSLHNKSPQIPQGKTTRSLQQLSPEARIQKRNWKKNPMVPQLPVRPMPKVVDYLAERRQARETNSHSSLDIDWANLNPSQKAPHEIRQIASQIQQKILKEQAKLRFKDPNNIQTMENAAQLDSVLFNSIKTKLALLESQFIVQMEATLEFILAETRTQPDKLYSLDLPKYQIVSIPSLKRFIKLKSVNLSSNFIKDLPRDFIEKLRELRELNLSCNELSSLQGLINPNLTHLNLSFNSVSDLELIKNLKVRFRQKLQVFICEGNRITQMKPLQSCGSLKRLDLSGNQISEIQGVSQTQLQDLVLTSNQISIIEAKSLPSTLKTLDLRKNQISNLKFLKKTPDLQSLNLEQNQLDTVSELPFLKNLTDLNLSRNQMFMLGLSRDINQLLPSLMSFDLSDNSFYDRFQLLALSEIPSLIQVNLSGNPFQRPGLQEELLEELPQILILNGKQVKNKPVEIQQNPRPVTAPKTLTVFDQAKFKRDYQQSTDQLHLKRKETQKLLTEIDEKVQQLFYKEFSIPKQQKVQEKKTDLEEVQEFSEMEREEQKWFDDMMTQMQKVRERKTPSRRSFKDYRSSNSQNEPVQAVRTARTTSKHRRRLDEARMWRNQQLKWAIFT